jgi:hypothetical protein
MSQRYTRGDTKKKHNRMTVALLFVHIAMLDGHCAHCAIEQVARDFAMTPEEKDTLVSLTAAALLDVLDEPAPSSAITVVG